MRRVVITGLGVVSSIGNNATEVLASLKAGQSGITANADMQEHGFRSQVAGSVDLDIREHVDKRVLRFMGPGAAYAFLSMQQAIADAGLEEYPAIPFGTRVMVVKEPPSRNAFMPRAMPATIFGRERALEVIGGIQSY